MNPARAVDVIIEAALAGAFDLLLTPELLADVADKRATTPYLLAQVSPRRVHLLAVLLQETGLTLPPYADPFPPLSHQTAHASARLWLVKVMGSWAVPPRGCCVPASKGGARTVYSRAVYAAYQRTQALGREEERKERGWPAPRVGP